MQVPLELTFRDVLKTDAVERLVREQAKKLEKFCDHIISCRVAIERPQQHQQLGSAFRVRIDLTVPPGHEIVAIRDPVDHDLHDDLQTVIISAFKVARRQLQELVERQRRDVKTHEEPRALIVRLFRDQGYGFLKTLDGREIYFHRNSVLHGDFERLEAGTEVRFEEAMGENGPQATTVQVVAKRGARTKRERAADEAKPPRGWEE